MALTANGLPFPVGTDLVRDGDNAIQALAAALELRGHGLRMVGQLISCDPLTNGYTWFRANLGGIPFKSPPFVWVTCQPANAAFSFYFNPNDIRSTGEIGGYMRDHTGGLSGANTVVTAYVLLLGPI